MPSSLSRVLMTSDALGGHWPYALDLSRALGARGVTVDLAVMGPALTPDQRAQAAAAGVHVIEGGFRLEWMDDPWSDVDRASAWLLDLERALKPDLIHLNGYCHGALPWRAPVVIAGHSCVRSWWHAVHGEDAPASWDEYHTRVRAGLLSASLVVAPTRAMLDDLQRLYGTLARVRVIPHGRAFDPAHHVSREPLVISVGRLSDEAKNIEALCSAARDITWPVYVAGDESHPGTDSVAPGYVHHLGRLSAGDIRDWYGRASIYALPARYEPTGVSVIEAALSGCALVLGDIRSLRENWGGAALFVPPDNRRALAFAVESLIDHPQLLGVLAEAARARARRFNVDVMADAYFESYAQVTRKGHRDPLPARPIPVEPTIVPWDAAALGMRPSAELSEVVY
jgi:glycogen synthase